VRPQLWWGQFVVVSTYKYFNFTYNAAPFNTGVYEEEMATNIEPDDPVISDVDLGWRMGHLSDLICQLYEIREEKELSAFILDHVLPDMTDDHPFGVALMNLLWLAYEFPADSEMRLYHTLCLPRHQLRQIMTYAALSRKGWAVNGRPTRLLLQSSHLEVWKRRGATAFKQKYGGVPPGQKTLAVIPLEEGEFSIGKELDAPQKALGRTEKKERDIMDTYNSPTSWSPVAGRPSSCLQVILYLFESSSNELTAMRAVKKILLWALEEDGRCKDKTLVRLCWMSLGLGKNSSVANLLSSPWMSKCDDANALLMHRYVELGVRGYVKGGEPTWLLNEHILITLARKQKDMVESNLAKLNWRRTTIFDILFTAMEFNTREDHEEHKTKRAKQGSGKTERWTSYYEMSFQI
jgi:hypothetical protein